MSTVVENTVSTYIPDDSEVQASTSRVTWRFAKGKICTGSEDGGTFQDRPKIVGRLRRIGIHDKTYQKADGAKRIYQLEADVDTANGPLRYAAALCDMKGKDQPSGVAIAVAWGLLQLAKDELHIITATQGTKKNEFGSYPTFVNFFHLKEGAKQGVEVARRQRSEEPMETTLARLLAEIRTHPAYADRPVAESDDEDGTPNTHLSALCKLAAEHGWPTPEQAPADWLKLYAALFNQTDVKASLAQVDDHDWGQTILVLTDRGNKGNWTVPKPLQEAAARLAATQPSANSSALD